MSSLHQIVSSLQDNSWRSAFADFPSDLPSPVSHEDRPASPSIAPLLEALPFNKIMPVSMYPPTFTCFPHLPSELRLAIWNATFLPRMIQLTFEFHTGFFSAAPLPIAFHVNQESRELANEKYPKCFGSRMHLPRTAFNFSMDTMYLRGTSHDHDSTSHLFGIMTTHEMNSLRYLAIDHMTLMRPFTKTFMKLAMKELPGLENLFVVYDLPEVGRSRYCPNLNCISFRSNVPYQIMGRPSISDTEKKFKDNKWADVDSTEPSRCKSVYGWRECQCTYLESNAESSGDEWDEDEDDDTDGFSGYGDYRYDDYGDYGSSFDGIHGGSGWSEHEIYGDEM